MKADRHAMVPEAEVRTYYDQPVIRGPVWTWEIPWYFFAGGLAGASVATGAVAARATDRPDLARVLETAAAAGAMAEPDPRSWPTSAAPSASTTCCACSSRARR